VSLKSIIRVSLVLGFAILALHFRPPETSPTKPEPFDPDLVELQLRAAPRDAQIVFLGDSITERWRFRPEIWKRFGPAANLGIGGAGTANVLWLVESGKLDVFHPRLFVVMIGANDLYPAPRFWQRRKATPQKVDEGIALITADLARQFPNAQVVTFPYSVWQVAERWLSVDGLHLSDEGYEAWARMLDAERHGSITDNGTSELQPDCIGICGEHCVKMQQSGETVTFSVGR
jgi:hypothetical protein